MKRSSPQLDQALDNARVLPGWDNVLRRAKVAHQACSNFVFVGWDVVFTELGPMLLDGNVHWDATEYQRLRGEPLGYTKFGDRLTTQPRGVEIV